MKIGTRTSLGTTRVHFGVGSIRKLSEEAQPVERAFLVTGRTLREKTDLVRRVEGILGGKHAGTFDGMGQHTPGSAVEEAARQAEGADLLVSFGAAASSTGRRPSRASSGTRARSPSRRRSRGRSGPTSSG
ncbi:iron-containing alcohol dehydrogenase [Rubrobacter marinus]|uniref:Iron-containing alcohol dehydrogenase n=1 Tax=Rubrobacter marinus TaxID=2653852 RepID=A0A6G8PYQ0_9ACTN|nr:iron-containing alcohol dehydrogenase [Rubrobacter marinus]